MTDERGFDFNVRELARLFFTELRVSQRRRIVEQFGIDWSARADMTDFAAATLHFIEIREAGLLPELRDLVESALHPPVETILCYRCGQSIALPMFRRGVYWHPGCWLVASDEGELPPRVESPQMAAVRESATLALRARLLIALKRRQGQKWAEAHDAAIADPRCLCGGLFVEVVDMRYGIMPIFRICDACGGAKTNSGKYLPPRSGFDLPALDAPTTRSLADWREQRRAAADALSSPLRGGSGEGATL